MSLWTAAPLYFVLSASCGYWRASVRRLSPQWFLALLLPAALLAAHGLYYAGLGRKPAVAVALAAAFLVGQFVGGRVRNIIQGRGPGRSKH
jgi:hypothetical protein